MLLDENLPAELQMDKINRVTMKARNLAKFLENVIKIPWGKHCRVLKV